MTRPIYAQGVSFFFILSGFVLAYAYSREPKPIGEYALARVARIYPLYLSAIAIALLLSGTLPQWRNLPEIFLVHDWSFTYIPAILGPGWSLSAEAFFYALFPLALIRPYIAFAASLVVLVILFAVPGIMEPGLYFCHPLVRLPEFLLGAVLYRLSAMWEPADENRLA
jgi:peptidoglycan/LPS O-acetylase OafA/YrhL